MPVVQRVQKALEHWAPKGGNQEGKEYTVPFKDFKAGMMALQRLRQEGHLPLS